VIEVRCAVVAGTPVGTNFGLVHLLWMLVSGRLLESRGAVIPALRTLGLPGPAVRRAWAALGQGDWTSAGLLSRWQQQVEQGGQWQRHEYEAYRPVAVDVTGFWRTQLQGCHRPPRRAGRHAPCATCTSTAGRSNSSPWLPNRCSAPLEPSSERPRPANVFPRWPSCAPDWLAPATHAPRGQRKDDPATHRKLALIAQAVGSAATLLYLDECDLRLLPVIRACWMKGPRLPVPTPGQNAKRALFGALIARAGRPGTSNAGRPERVCHFAPAR